MADSKKPTSSSCLSGVFSRLVCARSLPTHPTDHFIEPNVKETASKTERVPVTTRGPGAVARLMGLESLPCRQERTTFGSFLRSRSVSFLDYLPQLDPTQLQAHHRRAKTSVSFAESVLPVEKQDFLFICFDNEKRESVTRKAKASSQEMKHRKSDKYANKEKNFREKASNRTSCRRAEELKRSSIRPSSKAKTEVSSRKNRKSRNWKEDWSVRSMKNTNDGSKLRKRRKNGYEGPKNVMPRCHSAENWSSVSVSDHQNPSKQSQAAISDNGEKWYINSRKTRLKIGLSAREKYLNLDPVSPSENSREPQRISEKATMGKQMVECYLKMHEEICSLIEEDMTESRWVAGDISTFEFEDLCVYLGEQVLEIVLNELVQELLQF